MSGEELSKLMKRLRQTSWEAGSNRKSSPNADYKRAVFSKEIRDRRSSRSPRYNGYQLDSRKVGQWDAKANVPKRWLKEYEKKQVSFSQKKGDWTIRLRVSEVSSETVSNNNKIMHCISHVESQGNIITI